MKCRDYVYFYINDKVLPYQVETCYLRGLKYENDALFRELGVDPIKYCSNFYSIPRDGIWPYFPELDYTWFSKMKRDLESRGVLVVVSAVTIDYDQLRSMYKGIQKPSPCHTTSTLPKEHVEDVTIHVNLKPIKFKFT